MLEQEGLGILKKSKQNVLIVTPLFWPSIGGIQQFNEKFILELIKRGYTVDLLILKSEVSKGDIDQYLSSKEIVISIKIGFSINFFCRFIFGKYSKVLISQFSLRTFYYTFFPLRNLIVISHRDYPTNIEILKSVLSRFKLYFLRLPWIVNVAVSTDLATSLPGKTRVIHNRSWRNFSFQDVIDSRREIDISLLVSSKNEGVIKNL
jgi:hypothetical protein